MGVVVAIIVVVVCLGSLAIGFARSMHRQRERRLEAKGGWSSTPDARE
jgi:hypothetical protein